MKCPYVTIIVFAFALQVANAAPTYSIGAILDELLEINIRMSDVILRAKYEYGQVQANELKDTLGKIVIHKSPITNSYDWVNDAKQRIDSIKAFASTSDGRDVTDSTPKNVRSLFGRTFDAIGNQWNNWFNNRKIMDINESGFNGNGLIEDDENNNVLIDPCNDLIDDQNVNGDIFLKESIDSTDTVFTINNHLCDIDSGSADIYSENSDSANLDTTDVGTADSDMVNSVSTDLGTIESDNTISGNAYPDNLDSNNSGNTASEKTASSSVDTYNTVTGNLYSENTDLGNVDETSNTFSEDANSSNLESNNTAADTLDSENTDSGNSGSDNQTEEQTTGNEQATGHEQATGNEQAIGNEQANSNEQATDNEQSGDQEAKADGEQSGDQEAKADGEQSGDQEAKADKEQEQNWGEETSNNESNDVGWFESAIDSIVNFFS